MSDTKISIVLPTYNRSTFLLAAVQSCLNQTYANLELIVVDGGSTAETLNILAAIRDPRLIIVHQPDNAGRLPGALTLGFAHSTGGYLTWMQDDCLYAPQALELLARFLDNRPDVDFVYGDYWNMDEAGQLLDQFVVGKSEQLIDFNCVGMYHLWRRAVYEAIGDFDIDAFLVEDYEYWLRIARLFKMQPLHDFDHTMFLYRLHPASLTSWNYTNYRRVRISAHFKRARFGLSWRKYHFEMAWAHIGEAFASYQARDFRNVRSNVLAGIIHNPGWLRNRGVISIGLESMVGTTIMRKLRSISRRLRRRSMGNQPHQ